MNKHQRAKIKAIILAQIESVKEQIQTPENAARSTLRLDRLGSALFPLPEPDRVDVRVADQVDRLFHHEIQFWTGLNRHQGG